MYETLPFPEIIDNTAISAWRKCQMDWYYSTLRNLEPNASSIHLHAGKCYAKGLEVGRRAFYDGGHSEETAIAMGLEALTKAWGDFDYPDDMPKSFDRIFYALIEYFTEYPMARDIIKPHRDALGRSSLEFSFAIPLSVLNPSTGQPILYSGRFDMLAEREGALFVEDDKTASQLGSQWMRNWILDAQMTGYCYAARAFGYPVVGAILRGVSILKGKYGHAQAIVYRPEWQIERWRENLEETIRQMVTAWERKRYLYALDKSSCNSYGGCSFHQLCESQNPERWIEVNFQPRNWNPLGKEES